MVLGLVWDAIWSTDDDKSNRSCNRERPRFARRLLEQRRPCRAVRQSPPRRPVDERQHRFRFSLCEGALVFALLPFNPFDLVRPDVLRQPHTFQLPTATGLNAPGQRRRGGGVGNSHGRKEKWLLEGWTFDVRLCCADELLDLLLIPEGTNRNMHLLYWRKLEMNIP